MNCCSYFVELPKWTSFRHWILLEPSNREFYQHAYGRKPILPAYGVLFSRDPMMDICSMKTIPHCACTSLMATAFLKGDCWLQSRICLSSSDVFLGPPPRCLSLRFSDSCHSLHQRRTVGLVMPSSLATAAIDMPLYLSATIAPRRQSLSSFEFIVNKVLVDVDSSRFTKKFKS